MSHQARKRFGQNFLTDQTVIQTIIHSLSLQSGQHWVEIGPGLGALTRHLLAAPIRLDVIELDRDLVAWLKQTFVNQPQLTIHSADALNFDFQSLSQAKSLHIVGNLPYNISTPLLFHLLTAAEQITEMYLMLQKEVAQRICASAGSGHYGKLSVMAQYHTQAECLFDIEAQSFDPIPKVQSTFIRLAPYATLPVQVTDFKAFQAIVTQAFSQRRKTLRNTLKGYLNSEQIESLEIDSQQRAENLTVAQFATLSKLWSSINR
jgi:16S rRNA (adenine1518-N6/adenine1519-N6)-dimethyltransferase